MTQTRDSEATNTYRRLLEGLVGVPATEGNTVEVLKNGDEIFPSMLSSIRGAERSIDMLTFVYWKGAIAVEFAEALAERARAGVRVRVLLDAVGARKIERSLLALMEDAGARVEWFRPVSVKLWEMNHRTHRKVLVVDEETAYTGGVGIAEEWCGDAQDETEWRDTHFKVRGPAVDGLRAAFAQNWAETGNPLYEAGVDQFPEQAKPGSSVVQVVRGSSDVGWSDIATVLRALLQGAKEEIRITTAYLNPGDEYIDLVKDAVERGVHVQILVPGKHIDKRTSGIIAQEDYQKLLDAGVELSTFDVSMLHAKIATFDSEVSVVGSANLNQRSMNLDEEVVLVVLDPEITRRLEADFEEDLRRSTRVEDGRWEERPFTVKALEKATSSVEGFF